PEARRPDGREPNGGRQSGACRRAHLLYSGYAASCGGGSAFASSASTVAIGTRIRRPRRMFGMSPLPTSLYASPRPIPSTSPASSTVSVCRSNVRVRLSLVLGLSFAHSATLEDSALGTVQLRSAR